MSKYIDLSAEHDFAYKVADWITSGVYNDVVVYEFHKAVDPTGIWNCEDGYEAFVELSRDTYSAFLGHVDHFPAVISVVVKLAGEWLVCHDCGSNYYTGYGPHGILKLRKACSTKHVVLLPGEGEIEDWLKERFGLPKATKKQRDQMAEARQFEKVVKSIQSFCADLPRRPGVLSGLDEETIRDHVLAVINPVFKGRGNGEAKNGRGKTDILVRTKDGLNEHIFELKIWSGVESVNKAIEQLCGYLTWNNNHAGIVVLVYANGFTSVLKKVKAGLEKNVHVRSVEQYGPTAFRLRLEHPTDPEKHVVTHLELVPLA